MTEEVKQQPARDPLLDKEVTLKFTVEQLNGILNLLGTEITFIKVVGLVNEIQRQVAEQLAPEAADEQ